MSKTFEGYDPGSLRPKGRPRSRPDTPEVEAHREKARERYRKNREAISARTSRLATLRKAIGKISGPSGDLIAGEE